MNLEAVGAAMLADARADAERIVADARREAEQRVADARREAATIVEDAERDGERDASARLARERARVRRDARAVLLAAQRQVYDDLVERAHAGVRALARRDDYRTLIARLSAQATSQLGPDAVVTVDPDGEPGLTAAAGSRRVDYRLTTLADQAIRRLGPTLAKLWSR
jgi:vacuolar-type H+-ATPase subunit E/Vma4